MRLYTEGFELGTLFCKLLTTTAFTYKVFARIIYVLDQTAGIKAVFHIQDLKVRSLHLYARLKNDFPLRGPRRSGVCDRMRGLTAQMIP